MPPIARRALLIGLAAAGLAPTLPAFAAEDALAGIEARTGGRLGAFALDAGSGRSLAHRADARVLMCSTTKVALVGALLARVDAGAERLDRRVPYGAAALETVGYVPDTRAHLAEGGMTLDALCAAAIEHSDNGAANLVFAAVGGPAAVTRFVRAAGDGVTRSDRIEPALNYEHGDDDTTTPRAYAGLARALLLGDVLKPESRARLNGWMEGSTTGAKRIRAGVPSGWTVGDKTGSRGPIANDVAVLRPPGRAPIFVAAFLDAPGLDDAAREAALRDVGAAVSSWATAA